MTTSIYLVADLSTRANLSNTITTTFVYDADPVLSHVAVVDPDTVNSFATITGTNSPITITDLPDTLTVAQPLPADAGDFERGHNNYLIQAYNLTIGSGDDSVTVSSATITAGAANTAVASDFNGNVSLILDTDTVGYQPGVDTTLTTAAFSPSAPMVFNIPANLRFDVLNGQTRRLYLVGSTSATAQVNHYVQTQVGAIQVLSPDNPYVVPPRTAVVSGSHLIKLSTDILTIANAPQSSTTTVEQGQLNFLLGGLDFTAPAVGDGIYINRITVSENESALASDITSMRIVTGTGTVLESTTTFSPTIGNVTFSNFAPVFVAPGTTVRINVRVDISETANYTNNYIQGDFAAGSIGLVAPDVVSTGFTGYSGTRIMILDKPDILRVENPTVPASDYYRGWDDNLLQNVNLAVDAGNDTVTVTSVRVSMNGTAVATDFKSNGIKLWYDSNGNGTLETSGTGMDTTIAASSFANTITFNALPSNVSIIPANQSRRLFLTVSISPTAVLTGGIGNTVVSSIAVTAPDAETIQYAASMSSQTHRIMPSIDTLRVVHRRPALADVDNNLSSEQGTTNQVLNVLDLGESGGDGLTINRVNVRRTGTSSDSDFVSVKLIRDVNSNARYDAAVDTTIAATAFMGGIASFDLSSLPGGGVFITPDVTSTVMVAVDIQDLAGVGGTVSTNMSYAANDITLLPPDLIADYGTLTGANLTILDKPDTLRLGQTSVDDGAGNLVVVGTTNHVMQAIDLDISSIPQDRVTLNSITVRRTGTAVDSDTAVNLSLIHISEPTRPY
jgi:hypothetical protein